MAKQEKGTLTAKQKLFCEKMVEFNHKQINAYMAAYPDASYDTAKAQAWKLMRMDKVVNYINQLEEEALRQAGVTPARIANELARQAFADLDLDSGLTYQVKQNAIKMLQTQFGLDKKVIDAKVDTIIKVDIEDDTTESE